MEQSTKNKLPYSLTNDYLFRAVFQDRPKALEGLCRVVLGLKETDNVSVTLKNPIELGKSIDEKDFILDLAVVVNDSIFVNLEMQMYYDKFWTDRSLSYACRSFSNLNKGDRYNKVLPVVQVGFLSYDLFPEYPEFCANYQLANVSLKENPYIYNDKLRICVVNLSRIDLATEQDKVSGIELWARVFKATTWEEIDMLAQNNEYLQEVVSGVRQLTEEEKIRQQCEAREINTYWERIREADRLREQQELQNAWTELANQQQELANQQQELADQQQELADQQQELADQQQELADQQQELADQQQEFTNKFKNKIQRKITKGKSLEQIAEELEENIEELRPLYEELIASHTSK